LDVSGWYIFSLYVRRPRMQRSRTDVTKASRLPVDGLVVSATSADALLGFGCGAGALVSGGGGGGGSIMGLPLLRSGQVRQQLRLKTRVAVVAATGGNLVNR
jgi:hypothetical protein